MQIDTKRLRELIEAEFKTDLAFANRVDIHHSTLSRILSGKNTSPRLCIMARISRGLGITIDEMLLKEPIKITRINEEGAD